MNAAPPIWRDFAACLTAEPEAFFPDPARIDLVNAAKRICAICPVTAHCLNWAFLIGADSGIFGGKTAEERRVLLRQNGRAA